MTKKNIKYLDEITLKEAISLLFEKKENNVLFEESWSNGNCGWTP